jgi:hypothetical protein
MNINDSEIADARHTRNFAIACAFLSLTTSAALLTSNIGRDMNAEHAIEGIDLHERILVENQLVLHNNQKALAQILLALKAVKKPPPQ